MAKLKTFGYSIHCRQMVSVGTPTPTLPEDLSQKIAILRSVVEEAIGLGNNVVVVPHSWGGIVTSSALVGHSKKEREASGKKRERSNKNRPKTTGAAWKVIPTSYPLCEDDGTVVPQYQEAMIKAVEEAGAEIDVTRFMCGHSPILNKMDETAEWMRWIAGKKV